MANLKARGNITWKKNVILTRSVCTDFSCLEYLISDDENVSFLLVKEGRLSNGSFISCLQEENRRSDTLLALAISQVLLAQNNPSPSLHKKFNWTFLRALGYIHRIIFDNMSFFYYLLIYKVQLKRQTIKIIIKI